MKRPPRVTIGKHNGDDTLSWAVFVDGKIVMNGLSQREARYYRDQTKERLRKCA